MLSQGPGGAVRLARGRKPRLLTAWQAGPVALPLGPRHLPWAPLGMGAVWGRSARKAALCFPASPFTFPFPFWTRVSPSPRVGICRAGTLAILPSAWMYTVAGAGVLFCRDPRPSSLTPRHARAWIALCLAHICACAHSCSAPAHAVHPGELTCLTASHTCAHACVRAHAHTCMCTQPHMCWQAHLQTQAPTRVPSHTCACTHMLQLTCTRVHLVPAHLCECCTPTRVCLHLQSQSPALTLTTGSSPFLLAQAFGWGWGVGEHGPGPQGSIGLALPPEGGAGVTPSSQRGSGTGGGWGGGVWSWPLAPSQQVWGQTRDRETEWEGPLPCRHALLRWALWLPHLAADGRSSSTSGELYVPRLVAWSMS